MAFLRKELSTSQKQTVIKLSVKKDCHKRFIKSWGSIASLNVDGKLILKVLSNLMKNLLPNWFHLIKNVYAINRFLSEVVRVISDILEMTDILNMRGYLLTIDSEKTFDSVAHYFLIAILEKHDFKKNFLRWIKALLNNQESYIISVGITTH